MSPRTSHRLMRTMMWSRWPATTTTSSSWPMMSTTARASPATSPRSTGWNAPPTGPQKISPTTNSYSVSPPTATTGHRATRGRPCPMTRPSPPLSMPAHRYSSTTTPTTSLSPTTTMTDYSTRFTSLMPPPYIISCASASPIILPALAFGASVPKTTACGTSMAKTWHGNR